MGGQRQDQIIEDSFIGIEEAGEILQVSPAEVRQLIEDETLTAFQLGGRCLRLKKEQILHLEAQRRIRAELFPKERVIHHHAATTTKPTWLERIGDFFYFNDFYIVSYAIIIALVYLILSSE